MIQKTQGIVLHSFKTGETSLVARVLTRELGLQSYLVPGVRKPRARIRQHLFRPLTIVDMVVYHKEKEGLQRIREIHCPQPFESIPYHIAKSSIAIFLAEMLTRSLQKQQSSPSLFDFACEALRLLDQTTGKTADFHLVFLMQLSRFLGFQPRDNYDPRHPFFNLREGVYQDRPGQDQSCLNKELSLHFRSLMNTGIHDLPELSVPGGLRRALLQKTIDYYSYHLDGMQEIRSHSVLEMVLNEKT